MPARIGDDHVEGLRNGPPAPERQPSWYRCPGCWTHRPYIHRATHARGDCFEGLGAAAHQNDLCAFIRQSLSHGSTDPSACAGDQGGFASEAGHQVTPLGTMPSVTQASNLASTASQKAASLIWQSSAVICTRPSAAVLLAAMKAARPSGSWAGSPGLSHSSMPWIGRKYSVGPVASARRSTMAWPAPRVHRR